MKAMEGEWTDETGVFGKKGAVVATYKVTGAGSTVIESFAGGTQPRMRANEVNGYRLSYEFEGGSNIDVARTSHMHNTLGIRRAGRSEGGVAQLEGWQGRRSRRGDAYSPQEVIRLNA